MEETKIIKTKDENIVQEVTTITKEIDLSYTREQKEGCETRLAEYDETIKRLQGKLSDLDEELALIVAKKIADVMMCKVLDEQMLIELNDKLK